MYTFPEICSKPVSFVAPQLHTNSCPGAATETEPVRLQLHQCAQDESAESKAQKRRLSKKPISLGSHQGPGLGPISYWHHPHTNSKIKLDVKTLFMYTFPGSSF